MTVIEAIERADSLRPNPFSTEEKIKWLSELDGKIKKEIVGQSPAVNYSIDNLNEAELTVKLPYTDVYLFYLCAMIDFFSRDYAEYNNSMLMVNSILDSFSKAVLRGDEVYENISDNNGNTTDGDGVNNSNCNGKKSSRYYINIF